MNSDKRFRELEIPKTDVPAVIKEITHPSLAQDVVKISYNPNPSREIRLHSAQAQGYG